MERFGEQGTKRFGFCCKCGGELAKAAWLKSIWLAQPVLAGLEGGDNALAQGGNALAIVGDDWEDRDSQSQAEFFDVNLVAIFFGHINHVQRDQSGMAKLNDLS